MRVQKSYGIACYRKRFNNSQYEFLFINKRLSYAFISFVKGCYDKNLNNISLLYLLNNMTVDEKMILKSLNFTIIWYKLYLERPNINNKTFNIYNKLKKRFETNFLVDNGKNLISLIEKSTSINLIWELPKGHKNNKEYEVNASIREFMEETSIPKNKYKIMFNIKPLVYSFIDDNVKYVYTYFIAQLISKDYIPSVKLNLQSVVSETSDIKFLCMNEIELLVNDKKLITELKKLIKKLKNY